MLADNYEANKKGHEPAKKGIGTSTLKCKKQSPLLITYRTSFSLPSPFRSPCSHDETDRQFISYTRLPIAGRSFSMQVKGRLCRYTVLASLPCVPKGSAATAAR